MSSILSPIPRRKGVELYSVPSRCHSSSWLDPLLGGIVILYGRGSSKSPSSSPSLGSSRPGRSCVEHRLGDVESHGMNGRAVVRKSIIVLLCAEDRAAVGLD